MPSQPALLTHTPCLSALFEPEVPAQEAEEEAEEAGGGGPPQQGVSGDQEEKRKEEKVDAMRSDRLGTGNACQVSGSE